MTAANIKQPKALPPPDSDFYQLVETLPAEDLAVVKQVRAYMETKVQPIINKYWAEDEASCWSAWSPWRCRGSTPRSRPSGVSTTDSPWDPSTSADRRSRRKSGCRRWPEWRRSVASA